MTQKNIILEVLKAVNDWVPSFSLEKVESKWGYIGTSGLRRCRELENDGIIESKRDGKFVWYRIKRSSIVTELAALKPIKETAKQVQLI